MSLQSCTCIVRRSTSCRQLPQLHSCQGWSLMQGCYGCQLPFCEAEAPQNPHCCRQSEQYGCVSILAKCPHPD